MKTEVKKVEQVKNELPFPKLMATEDGLIVFFTIRNNGVVVFNPEVDAVTNYVGTYSEDWYMPCFSDLPSDQQVILQND